MLQISCPNCGANVSPNYKFCSNCGAGIGWGTKIKDVQQQITQAEANIITSVSQYAEDTRNTISGIENDLKNTLASYSNEFIANQRMLGDAANGIHDIVKEEHRMALSRTLNRTGLGIMAVGLGVVTVTYFVTSIPLLPVIGLGVIFVGFIIQVISNFYS